MTRIRKHNGRGMPCNGDAMVVARRRSGELTGALLRDGIESQPVKAEHLALSWTWAADSDHPLDVVAWRYAEARPEEEREAA